MVRFSRLILSSILVVSAMGVGSFLWRGHTSTSGAKSVDAYWASTGLESQALEDIFESQICFSSEKHFLACVSALQSAAQFVNLKLETNKEYTSLNQYQQKQTEIEILKPWQELYRSEIATGLQKFSFYSLWKELESKIKTERKARIIGAGLNGFLSLIKDPHTYLIPVDYYNEVISQSQAKSISIGMSLVQDPEEKSYLVRKVLEKSVAESSGLKKGDRILTINGKDVTGLSFPAVSDLLKGEEGTQVSITIQRGDEKKLFLLTRKVSISPAVSSKTLPSNQQVGVISIHRFAKNTCREVREQLRSLRQNQKVTGLLLDLRDNPGGQMEEAACVAGLFIGGRKKIFELRFLDTTAEPESYYGGPRKAFSGPMAVLINSGSASASEIVAGALRDYGRAYLVGERTFGKGSFQEGEIWQLNQNLALFETKGFYYLPSGKSPQVEGLQPDIEIKNALPSQRREGDQYWSALEAQPIRSWANAFAMALPGQCEKLTGESSGLDSEVIAGQKSIECLSAGLRNDSN